MARRSTRLSSRNSSTPQPIKRVSLSHDAPAIRTPRTVPARLASLHESDEMPGSFPDSPSEINSPSIPTKRIKVADDCGCQTPKFASPIQLTAEEMHPQLHHETTVKPREEARWLGFSKMAPATEPVRRENKLAAPDMTPSRTSVNPNAFKSPDYQFTFRREQSLELSPEAKKLMVEKRAEALKIKEQMKSTGEGASLFDATGRKVATPSSRKGRYSDVHAAQFQKMDSIAAHASAYRKDPTRTTAITPESKNAMQAPAKLLKRSHSKAELDKVDATPPRKLPQSQSLSYLHHTTSQLPRSRSMKDLAPVASSDQAPAKRIKRVEEMPRPTSSGSDKAGLTTPQIIRHVMQPQYPSLPHLTTPTQASLARANSAKSVKTTSKIPALGLARSPSKPDMGSLLAKEAKQSGPLLSRSPTKGEIFGKAPAAVVDEQGAVMSPLLVRSPTKFGLHKSAPDHIDGSPSLTKSKQAPLLSRAPVRANGQHTKSGEEVPASPVAKSEHVPLLRRSPLKASIRDDAIKEEAVDKPSSIPLLARSPSKMSLNQNPFDTAPMATPSKIGTSLMGRFNKLRATPIKSILRSPQRLYSNDPAKVAAGTHVATPPRAVLDKKNARVVPATAPVRKHVDFSSSTKAREASKSASPSEPTSPAPALITCYPTLPTLTSPLADVSTQRRRQTVAPGDFTFRAGSGIVFGPSPTASPAASSRPATIRHVSAEPALPPPVSAAASMQKRKFDFENQASASAVQRSPTVTLGSKKRKLDSENEELTAASDKENAGDEAEEAAVERPKKRIRTAEIAQGGEKKGRLPTLGVKPKGGEKKEVKAKGSSVISRARLNALAMPKKRG
ncbi:hypothetical protein LTR95_016154 [Oleoguttula sp. CCFEE 5521]